MFVCHEVTDQHNVFCRADPLIRRRSCVLLISKFSDHRNMFVLWFWSSITAVKSIESLLSL